MRAITDLFDGVVLVYIYFDYLILYLGNDPQTAFYNTVRGSRCPTSPLRLD